jgi:hypothetical protein
MTENSTDENIPLDRYYQPINKNKFYQRESANVILDTRAPMTLYDSRIKPTLYQRYLNTIPGDPVNGDEVGLHMYDPLSITPWDMLTDAQKKLRVKRFGRNGVPEDYDPDRLSVPKNLPYKNAQLLQQPEDRLVREYNTLVLNEDYKKVYDHSPYSTKEYGPEGQFTHWAKEDEKIPNTWRPIKGTPSDLFVSKRVKFKSGGWLDKYQGDKGSSQVKTYKSDPSYFDNRAVFVDNPQANDLVRSKVYAGTHGWDSSSNSLVKLDKPVAVPKAVQEMSTSDWGKKNQQERFESNTPAGKATRKSIAAREMEQAVTNPYFRAAIPTMLLPGLPALGEAAYAGLMSTPIGAATAGALGSNVAPGLSVGTLGQGLMDSYFASQAPNQLMTANTNFKSGNITEGLANTGLAAMNLFPFSQYIPKRGPGPLMLLDDTSKGVNRAIGNEPHLSDWQKLRIAEGKPVYTGSGQLGNITMGEMSAKKQLNKSINVRENPKKVKKLTKEQEYERLLRESYQRTGGQINKYQVGGDKMDYTWSDEFGNYMTPEVTVKPTISPAVTQALLNREAGMSIAPAPSSFDRKISQAQYMMANPFDAFGNYVRQGYVPQGNLGNYGMREKSSPIGQLLMDFNPYNYANAAYRAAIRGGDPDTYTTLPGAINMGADLAEALPVISKLGPLLKGAKSAIDQFGEYLTTQTPLKNTYKYNPLAFKPEEGMMYRGLGEEGYLDAIQSSVLKPKQYGYDLDRSFAEKITTPKQFGSTYYTPAETFGIVENYGSKYVAEVPFEGNQFGKRYGRKNWSWSTPRQIPIEEAKLLQKDWLQGYKQINKSKQLPSSPNSMGPGPMMLGFPNYTHEVKNVDYFKKMLDSYSSNKLSSQSKKYFEGIINSVRKQEGLATKKQYDMLQRLRTGDFNYGKKDGGESQGEGYYDYINGYSGIFAKGGTKGWLDNYN